MQPPPSGALGRHPRTRPPCTSPTRPLASGSVDLYRLYTTPPEDFSSRTLRVRRALRVVLQHPFSGGRRALRGVRRARTYLWLANHTARVSPQAPSGKGDNGLQPACIPGTPPQHVTQSGPIIIIIYLVLLCHSFVVLFFMFWGLVIAAFVYHTKGVFVYHPKGLGGTLKDFFVISVQLCWTTF